MYPGDSASPLDGLEKQFMEAEKADADKHILFSAICVVSAAAAGLALFIYAVIKAVIR